MSLFFSTTTNLPPTPKSPSSRTACAAPRARHDDQRPLLTPGADASSLRAARAISSVYVRAIVPIKSQYDSPGVVTACSSMPS
ncbi:hypothetical protein C8J57DRAFT_1508427 [Mycena rebaudengoi]|nr:hypothetical protein C8J57DRAFT_1527503 [Mycena rebaudengoi]KAJ7270389.1 hypothetical protein C8J57DRAFT_1508427 [Mycena rebaudengoi]